MACDCNTLQGTLRVPDPVKFTKGKSELGLVNKIHLFKCSECGQHWLLDEWERFKGKMAFKIKDASHWEKMDTAPLRKAYLVLSKGGTTTQPCSINGCKGHQVKGGTLCVDHLYTSPTSK